MTTIHKQGQSLAGRIFLFIFSLPFLAVGLFMSWLTISSLVTGISVMSWVQVPATILTLELKEDNSGESASHEVEATYQYRYEGADYTSSRVGLERGSDGVGQWHQKAFRRLEALRAQNQVTASVNPAKPDEAYLVPDLRPMLIAFKSVFALIFTGAALCLIVGVVFRKAEVTRHPATKTRASTGLSGEALAKLRPPTLPTDEDPREEAVAEEEVVVEVPAYTAQDRVLKYNHASGLVAMSLFAIFWNAISWTLVIAMHEQFWEKAKAEPGMWLILIFPLTGIMLLWGMLNRIARSVRYWVSILELAEMPGVLGGRLSGAITTKGNLASNRSVEVTLSCLKLTETKDSEGDTRTTTAPQWEDSYELRPDSLPRTGGATSIPVLFAIPYGLPMSGERGDTRTVWKVSVAAQPPGADYQAEWEVPVYRTLESKAGYRLASNPLSPYLMAPDPVGALHRVGITVRPTALGGMSWSVRPTPIRSGAPGCLMFTLVIGIVLAVTLLAKAPLIVPLLLGLLVLGSLAILLQMLLGRSEIRVENGVLSLNKGFAGLNKTMTYPLANVQSLEQTHSMTANSVVYYKLQFIMADGKKVSAGSQLKGQRLIDFLKGSIRAEMKKQRGR